MLEKILVPLDGSRVGESALPCVEELVAKLVPHHRVEVILFQSVIGMAYYLVAGEASVPVRLTDKELQSVKQKAKRYLDKIALGLRAKGATVKVRVGVGDAAEAILQAAQETGAGLIAMSTHGRSGLSRWALGSVTDRVLRAGVVPLLTVRATRGEED